MLANLALGLAGILAAAALVVATSVMPERPVLDPHDPTTGTSQEAP